MKKIIYLLSGTLTFPFMTDFAKADLENSYATSLSSSDCINYQTLKTADENSHDNNTSNQTLNQCNVDQSLGIIRSLELDNTLQDSVESLGEGVAGSTALSAALSALPQMSKESRITCGVGTGAYSSKYAFGFGCASNVTKRFDVNAGGSYVFGGSKSYGGGTLDSGVVKAGFALKLGELNKPTQLSLNESKLLEKEVKDLKAKNDEIISQNQKLLSRLEKLENVALKFKSRPDMISVATKE